MGKKTKFAKNTKTTLRGFFRRECPSLVHILVYIKWSIRHNIPFFNTTLTRQVRVFKSQLINELQSMNYKREGKRVLFFSMRQDPPHLAWNSVLEMSLILRGNDVKKVACDGLIRMACNSGQYPDVKRMNCPTCKLYSKTFHKNSPTQTDWISMYSTRKDWEEASDIIKKVHIQDYEKLSYKGFPVGEYAKSSTVHFLREGEIGLDTESREVYKNFIIAGIAMIEISERILKENMPEIVVIMNGWFISERILLESAIKKGIRVVTYENGFRSNTLYFSEGKPIEYQITELWDKYKDKPLNSTQNEILNDYLESRENGDLGWVVYESINNNRSEIQNSLGLDKDKKVAVAFSSISWDSTLWGLDLGFKDLEDWLVKTILFFIKNQEYQLVIRLHPGEIVGSVASRDSMAIKIKKIFPTLPSNIVIIPPTSDISSYVLMDISDIGLVYTSTTGLEMSSRGKPVVVAGLPHYRNKGFTYDVFSVDDYYNIVVQLMSDNQIFNKTEERKELSRRYSYRLFFDGCLPFNATKQIATYKLGEQIKFNFDSICEILPKKDKYLDEICHRIIYGKYTSS